MQHGLLRWRQLAVNSSVVSEEGLATKSHAVHKIPRRHIPGGIAMGTCSTWQGLTSLTCLTYTCLINCCVCIASKDRPSEHPPFHTRVTPDPWSNPSPTFVGAWPLPLDRRFAVSQRCFPHSNPTSSVSPTHRKLIRYLALSSSYSIRPRLLTAEEHPSVHFGLALSLDRVKAPLYRPKYKYFVYHTRKSLKSEVLLTTIP